MASQCSAGPGTGASPTACMVVLRDGDVQWAEPGWTLPHANLPPGPHFGLA